VLKKPYRTLRDWMKTDWKMFRVQMERKVNCRMAVVIKVREIATDLQPVLRLLQVIYEY